LVLPHLFFFFHLHYIIIPPRRHQKGFRFF
jgi:hypothetical protein